MTVKTIQNVTIGPYKVAIHVTDRDELTVDIYDVRALDLGVSPDAAWLYGCEVEAVQLLSDNHIERLNPRAFTDPFGERDAA